jgi:Ser/Thr protein kinase RdoA (MazF antagonist)
MIVQFLHGDFYDAQVLIGNDRVAFRDFDQACMGPAACDLGNFAARLHAAALVGDLPAKFIEPLTDQLLAGYGAKREVAEAATEWSVAALLRLAPEPFRLRRRDFHAEIKATVARAEQMLQSASAVVASPRKTCETEAEPAIESDAPLAPLAAAALNLREMHARLSDAIST